MKKIILFVLVCCLATSAFAQKELNTGTVKYNVDIESSRSGTSKQMQSTFTVFLTTNKSRTDVSSTLGSEATVYDASLGKGFILKEYSGQKLMITATKKNWMEKNESNSELKFTIEDATSTIAGYVCKKATAMGADGKTIVVFFTSSVSVTNDNYNGSFPQLPGLPVKYVVSNGNLKLTYTLDTVSFDAVPSSKFEAPTSGYRVMTYDENQQLKVKD